MSRRNSHSVTSNSINKSHTKEEIFLQPIDQQYEKTKETSEIEDVSEFFIEYEQRQNMKQIINMIVETEISTYSECYSTVSKSKENREDEIFSKPKPKKILFTKIFLVEKWKKNVEEFIKKQTNKILNSSLSIIGSQILVNSTRMSDPERRPRNFLISNLENGIVNEMKLSRSLISNQKSINAVNNSYMKSPFI